MIITETLRHELDVPIISPTPENPLIAAYHPLVKPAVAKVMDMQQRVIDSLRFPTESSQPNPHLGLYLLRSMHGSHFEPVEAPTLHNLTAEFIDRWKDTEVTARFKGAPVEWDMRRYDQPQLKVYKNVHSEAFEYSFARPARDTYSTADALEANQSVFVLLDTIAHQRDTHH